MSLSVAAPLLPANSPDSDTSILVVDDEELNLEILCKHIEPLGYQVTTATDGAQAWELLEGGDATFPVVLLDRMMPMMDGMEVLSRMRASPRYRYTQVILQTAKAGDENIAQGLRCGANYYLTKPFDGEVMRMVLRNAIESYGLYSELNKSADETRLLAELIDSVSYRFQTLEQAKLIASHISRSFTNPSSVLVGLIELMINAIEHGNLGINYEEKTRLLREQRWHEAVAERQREPAYRDRFATVELSRTPDFSRLIVEDQGNGFDWEKYLDFSPERAFDLHGRGIAMANNSVFDSLEYSHGGRRVIAGIVES